MKKKSDSVKNTEEKNLIEQWAPIEKELEDLYFFTKQQVTSVFNLHYDDPTFVKNLIDETVHEYFHLPSEMLVNDYLYQTLMEVEDIHPETTTQ